MLHKINLIWKWSACDISSDFELNKPVCNWASHDTYFFSESFEKAAQPIITIYLLL